MKIFVNVDFGELGWKNGLFPRKHKSSRSNSPQLTRCVFHTKWPNFPPNSKILSLNANLSIYQNKHPKFRIFPPMEVACKCLHML